MNPTRTILPLRTFTVCIYIYVFYFIAMRNGYQLLYIVEKLFRLKSMMRTPKGKSLAIERDRFMQTFVDQIDREFSII